MSGKNVNFSNEKINKSSFCKSKKLFNIYDIYVNKILASKKEPYCRKAHLNALLDMMIMTTVDHYV